MTSGALRATWNSSGELFLPLNTAQPLRTTAASTTSGTRLRMFGILLRPLLNQEGPQYQYGDANANRGVGGIEDEKGAEAPNVQVREVDHIAVARPSEDVAERSAEDHAQ